ncbi:multidrug transporter [Flavobacterium akiainvivens]|uniref:Multidrug export protein MepA n=1 Tax=Flavobacterium akiainvivens TaxID=1202724 RepID=A0A0M9VIW7_9FLAO|nr:MATE family efflux transporter [Flavobacterium akiainvivens]KOS07166.1 multidrug transporter [Flavobacterium akiainvivens]SFQ73030.1 putative efflux protein, MATE family [Flavobacterium akiainvivens]
MDVTSKELAKKDIKSLLIKQSIPSSVGILFMSVNILIDTIFVGRWIGSLAIAALSVVLPITFFISSLGMAIGVGGSSVLSRALGAGNKDKAISTFAHQLMMTFIVSSVFVAAGLFFGDEILYAFGANGKITPLAKEFFFPILLAVPFQALCMMGNNVMRAEDKSKHAMVAMIISTVSNLVLDVVFIKFLNLGVMGAALATSTSFVLCFAYIAWFFLAKSELKLHWHNFVWDKKLSWEIISMSFVTFARQGVISILNVLLNHTLFAQGGEAAITIYGIVSRLLMFMLFPVLGVTQGFLPVAGYNYGAGNTERVRKSVGISIKMAGGLAIVVFAIIMILARPIVSVFTTDPHIIAETPGALRWVFAASPIIAVQLIGAAYFQAAGKPTKALMLTLSKQGFFLIPLVLLLPQFLGLLGVWIAFPIADVLSTIVTGVFLKKEMGTQLKT